MEEDKTLHIGAQNDCTIRLETSATASTTSSTGRTLDSAGEKDVIAANSSCYVIKGCPYRILRQLSVTSGEAQVFHVENPEGECYVLKLYYPKYVPQQDLLRIIWNMSFEAIVKLYDYGVLMVEGVERSYELMEYLEGGSLAEYRLEGNEEEFRRIALCAAAALSYCHAGRILHKDIKPGNLFFRDAEHQQLVLGDFGISVLLPPEGSMRTTQARTPVYAAPEMYMDVIDGEVELTAGADFYSLGVTLLQVWLGRNPFPKDERAMMRMKNEGRIPEINTLPPAVRQIIRGMTAANPDKRWTFDEVERWYQGEEVPVDESSFFLRYKSFMVDPEQNLVAADARELALLLHEHRQLGIRYLYSKRISRWLEECGNTKLAVILDDIVERRFPLEQDLGLSAAIYAMDKDFPYFDVKGRPCRTIQEITLTVLSYQEEYAQLLKNPGDLLYIYLEIHKDADRQRLCDYFKTQEEKRAVAMFLFEIDETLPFLDGFTSFTIRDIVQAFGTGRCSEDQWNSLVDGRLLAWMNVRENKVLCESVRILTDGQSYSEDLAYKVLYTIDPQCAFNLREADTPEAVARLLNEALQANQTVEAAEFERNMADFISLDGKLHYYATLRGWMDVLNWQNQCMDMSSNNSRKRLGTYDIRIAAYKLCTALQCPPVYIIRENEERTWNIHEVTDLEQVEVNVVCRAIRKDSLRSWLAVKYYENPFLASDEEYGYEYALEEFLNTVGRFYPKDPYYKRFMEAKEQSERKYEETETQWKKACRKERMLKIGYSVLAACLAGMVLLLGIPNKELFIDNVWLAIWLPLGLVSFIVFTLRGHHFINNGIAFALLMGGCGLVAASVPVYILKWVYTTYSSLLPAVLALFVGIYWWIGIFFGRKNSTKQLENFEGAFSNKEDISTKLLEPLYYTFKTKAYKYRGSKFGLLDDVAAEVRFTEKDISVHYMSWIFLVLVMITVFVWFHPALLDHTVPDKATWKGHAHEMIEQIKDVK